jgi:hypothetical protein
VERGLIALPAGASRNFHSHSPKEEIIIHILMIFTHGVMAVRELL